ncbi:hypothetical protein DVH05_026891 [Phytophthora capsici]|nr:hypothetical protein DVH05_026891 [Phytophthora capsici]
MGAKQSALKKEIAALQQESRKRLARHQEELANATKERRQLQAKIDELQAAVTLAQEEANKAKDEAREREERMKALKWELVRQLKMTGSPTSPTQLASLSPSSSTRIPLNWRLNDEVTLRQSVVSPKNEAAQEKRGSNDKEISSNPPPTAAVNLLAPRRSLLKRSDPRAESSPNPNENDTKEASNAAELSATSIQSETKPSKSPRDSKSSDNSPRGVDSTPPSSKPNRADSKDTEEEDD